MGTVVEAGERKRALSFLRRWSRVEIEIGSGNGHFLAAYGNTNTHCGLLGIELKKKRTLKIQKKIDTRRLSNVMIFCGNAESLFQGLSPASIDAFHLYFPDPWPKTKQRKRRFLKLLTLQLLFTFLKDGGMIYFISDVLDYYIQTKLLALYHGGFRILDEGIPDEVIHSLYAQRTEREGRTAYRLALVK